MLEEERFKHDYADPEPNIDSLDEIFNTSSHVVVDMETGEIIDEVNKMRSELKDIKDNIPDIDQIILDNIDRANRILNRVEDTIGTGAFTASMIEAAGKLIDSVTSAATSITGIGYNNETLRQKERDLDIKEKKLMIDGALKNASNVNITNNNLVMNREELMKLIKEGRPQ